MFPAGAEGLGRGTAVSLGSALEVELRGSQFPIEKGISQLPNTL